MKKNFRVLGIVLVLMLAVFVTVGFAEEAKKYPPYPDVWGYEFSWPSSSQLFTYKMPNGDYAITCHQGIKPGDKYVVKFFFSGEEVFLTKQEYKKSVEQKKYAVENKAVLKNGDIIQLSPYEECGNSFTDNYFYKTNKKGQIVFKKMAFYLHDKPKKITFENLYDLRKCAGNGEMLMVIENAGNHFAPLDDGGFLFLNLSGGFIIRFDKDLKTKSDLINKKIFLIDKDLFDKKFFGKHIGKIKGKPKAKDYQALHDDLLKYFMEIKNKQTK